MRTKIILFIIYYFFRFSQIKVVIVHLSPRVTTKRQSESSVVLPVHVIKEAEQGFPELGVIQSFPDSNQAICTCVEKTTALLFVV